MSSGLETLSLKSDDMLKLLAVSAHTGSENLDYQMEQYVYKRSQTGTHIFNLRKTWEKILLAARAIVAIKNPSDVFVISSYVKSQRAILKFASYTGATPIAGRFTPGTFTNQIQKNFREPLLLIISDPYVDHQPLMEAACVNIPVIAFCNAESPMKYVDVAIPCNNKGVQCIGLMYWLLAREVLKFRGTIPRDQEWSVMPDLFFYREPEEVEKDALMEASGGPVSGALTADKTTSHIMSADDQMMGVTPSFMPTSAVLHSAAGGGPKQQQAPPDSPIAAFGGAPTGSLPTAGGMMQHHGGGANWGGAVPHMAADDLGGPGIFHPQHQPQQMGLAGPPGVMQHPGTGPAAGLMRGAPPPHNIPPQHGGMVVMDDWNAPPSAGLGSYGPPPPAAAAAGYGAYHGGPPNPQLTAGAAHQKWGERPPQQQLGQQPDPSSLDTYQPGMGNWAESGGW